MGESCSTGFPTLRVPAFRGRHRLYLGLRPPTSGQFVSPPSGEGDTNNVLI